MTDLNSTLAEMREHHFPIPYVYFDASGTACAHGCSGEWPCDTDKLLAAVEAAVAVHLRVPAEPEYPALTDYCKSCNAVWPCQTYRALESELT